MDWRTKLERGGAGVLHLRPSRDQVAGDLSERRTLDQRHCPRVNAQVRRSRRQRCRGVERIRASCCDISPTGRVVSVLWEGVSGARRGLRDDRVGGCRKVKGEGRKGRERVALEKRPGTSASLYLAKAGLADEVGFDVMPGGEGRQTASGGPQVRLYAFNQMEYFYEEKFN
jgi:hypothetical protein